MTNQMKNKPVEILRDGALKAAIWKNEHESSVFYNVTFSRTYKDAQDALHDTDSYSGAQLLRLARLAELAYTTIGLLNREDKSPATPKETEEVA